MEFFSTQTQSEVVVAGDDGDQHTFEELHQLAHANVNTHSKEGTTFEMVFWYYRDKVHGPLGISLCTLGLALNMISCTILRKKDILVTGNLPLLAISAWYMVISLAFLPLLITLYCIAPHSVPKDRRNTYVNMMTATVSNQLQLVAHAIVLWLGVFMGLQRLICTTSRTPIRQNRLLSEQVTRLAILLIVLVVCVTSVPSFLTSNLALRTTHSNETVYQHEWCRNASGSGNLSDWTGAKLCRNVTHVTDLLAFCNYYVMTSRPALRAPVHWVYIILHKILPCVLMILISGFLVRSLRQLVGRRKRLTGNQVINTEFEECSNAELKRNANAKTPAASGSAQRLRVVNRDVTRMLVVLVVFMVVTQLPPAILLVWDPAEYRKYGDAFDVFSVLDNTASFILYCKMSATFRKAFLDQLHSCFFWRHCKTTSKFAV